MKKITTPGDPSAGCATSGQEVKAHYTGYLDTPSGDKFDSSVDRGQVFKFTVGQGQVIKAWDTAFMKMHKGEKATIVLKSDYGYGDHGSPPKIPGKATLCFEVELIDFGDKEKEIWEMSLDEKVEKCKKIKDEATGLFKEKRFAEAAAMYDSVSEYFTDEDGAIETDEANKVFTSSMSNAAMCYIKAKDYAAAIASCGRVLKEVRGGVRVANL